MEDIMALGATIRKYRKAKNLTLQAVGASLGMSYQSIQKWEKNRAEPNTSQLLALANLFDVSVNVLVNDDVLIGNLRAIAPFNDNLTFHLPFVTVSNKTTLLNTYKDNDSIQALSETFPVTVSNITLNKSHVVIEVEGDIMESRLRNGDKVLGEAIAPENFLHEHGGVYAVMYGKKFVIRRIINNDIEQHGKLFLHADNPKYDPFPIDAKNIRAMWKVIRVVDAPID
ncbi:helix-turn-helix domain-containing protein [Spirosoma sp. HMF3257]|uniref:HTH cro/C1-type domain-containing protein n=1 Tax=Spirosoma telluris TaxID=2183553 RepID=A0A327NNL3_9BACT|nr:helix-turn-helix domain-containing protein [Spirosoma telluris]RAI75979.1 hypothetical protein HMF3257_20680 [Spirosoma telluris]